MCLASVSYYARKTKLPSASEGAAGKGKTLTVGQFFKTRMIMGKTT
jgi:hypothetical protein